MRTATLKSVGSPGLTNAPMQVCTRCIIDDTVPGASFDSQGICAYCRLHDEMDALYPLTPEGEARKMALVERVRQSGRGGEFDCIVGISGGRDSTYLLHLTVQLGLRPLAVHFNDGFGNPVAGENMAKATERLGVKLLTITSDWRESKDLKIACLRASVPNANMSTDLGLAAALFGAAARHKLKYVLIGQSFRTEGIAPLPWNYLDGKHLAAIHKRFGSRDLRPWHPTDPGFHLGSRELFYYLIVRRIRTVPLLYYHNYVRADIDQLLKSELGWVNPGAHYFDDLYQALLQQLQRVKFNMDRRKFNYSALVRSGQMSRETALAHTREVYALEDPKVIDLCIKRLGLKRADYEEILANPPKTFRDYPSGYDMLVRFRPLIRAMAAMNLVPKSTYLKYFKYAC
jgi:hypothetical protein